MKIFPDHILWKGFTQESKLFMDYPTIEQELNEYYHSDLVNGKSCRQRKIEFWLRFPRAWLRFQWSVLTQRGSGHGETK